MIKEIEKVLQSIETDIFEQTGIEYFNIVVKSNGFCNIISFIGIELWNSEDDMRDFDEEKDEYESIESYLRKRIIEEIEKLHLIKL